MRKIFITLSIALLSVVTTTAQMTEGSVHYSMDFSSDDPDTQMAIAMMMGSSLNLYFQGENTRADVNMGSMMDLVTITNAESEEFIMLMDISMMGMKYAISSTLEELEAQNDQNEPEMEISFEDETKKILGYKCHKAIATDEDGNESIFWYTEEIEVSKRGQNYLNEQVPGFPLEYEITQGGMLVKLTATEVNLELDKKEAKELFDMSIPEGYEEKTLEELGSMGAGM